MSPCRAPISIPAGLVISCRLTRSSRPMVSAMYHVQVTLRSFQQSIQQVLACAMISSNVVPLLSDPSIGPLSSPSFSIDTVDVHTLNALRVTAMLFRSSEPRQRQPCAQARRQRTRPSRQRRGAATRGRAGARRPRLPSVEGHGGPSVARAVPPLRPRAGARDSAQVPTSSEAGFYCLRASEDCCLPLLSAKRPVGPAV